MVKHTINKLPKNTIEITVSVPWSKIQEFAEKAFIELQKDLSVEGFRKGKVPKSIAKKHLDEKDIYNKALQQIIPEIYEDIVKKENVKPIINPKVKLTKSQKDEDWEIVLTTAEAPDIDLSNYKTIIEKVKSDEKAQGIWTPGKEETKEQEEEKRGKKLNAIIKALLDGIKVEVSELIVEDEVNRRLAQLVDDTRKVGLTLDNYLKTKNTSIEKVKEQYTQEVVETYKFEYILQKIADTEHISVEQKDIDAFIEQISDQKEQEIAKQNSYLYAAIMRKHKALDFLNSL